MTAKLTEKEYREAVSLAVNRAAFAAANAVYDFSSKFPDYETYRPIDRLAARVQRIVVRTFAEAMKTAQEGDEP